MLHLELRKQSEEIAANDVEYVRIPLEIERLQMCQMIPDVQWAFGALLGGRCDRIGPRLLNLHEVYTSTGSAWSEYQRMNGRWLAVSIAVCYAV